MSSVLRKKIKTRYFKELYAGLHVSRAVYMIGAMKHSQIVELWDSQAQMARDVGVTHFAVNKWYKRGNIPVEYWERVVAAAREKGIYISYEMLVEGLAA